jgi:ketosteroid isomerase-like protein
MSEENEQTLRAFLKTFEDVPAFVDALKRGDADLAALDPDIVYEDANLPDHVGETYRGPEGILRAAERWADASETLTLELKRIVGSGDSFVSVHEAHSKARHSGIELDGPLAYAWTFRAGRVVHFQSYRDPTEALEAAGLRE